MDENYKLYKIAFETKQNAYAPYSNFHVGAAVLTSDKAIFTGVNIENASFGATICAERVAIFKAISESKAKITKIAIASDYNDFTYPCGICRQVMAEFMQEGIIILGNNFELKTFTIAELIPSSFVLK